MVEKYLDSLKKTGRQAERIRKKGVAAIKLSEFIILKNRQNTIVESFEGKRYLDTVVLKNLKTGELDPVKVDTCFEFIGYLPNTKFFKSILGLSKQGCLITNENMGTKIPGAFACGDVREKELRQVSAAVGDGERGGGGRSMTHEPDKPLFR